MTTVVEMSMIRLIPILSLHLIVRDYVKRMQNASSGPGQSQHIMIQIFAISNQKLPIEPTITIQYLAPSFVMVSGTLQNAIL